MVGPRLPIPPACTGRRRSLTFAPAPERLRTARILSAREQRALRGLVALGADLDAQFTADQLRRAFRILARRYHPDRHPDTDAAATARLARTFAEVVECHRCLLSRR
jgi:hypothetical protein